MRRLIASAAILFAASGAALAAPAPIDTPKGPILTGDTGMTLYTFKKDTKGVWNCTGKCAESWPPFLAAEGTKATAPYSLVERADDTYQWAKDGMPLYYWIKDKSPGDTTGDGVNDVWDVARP